MQIKIVNRNGEEKIFNSQHVFCKWNVLPKWEGELYRWYFESDHEALLSVSDWIFKDNLDIRTHEIYLLDDNGLSSENIIPLNDNTNIWMNYNPETTSWLYVEIRTDFEGDGLGEEVV